MIKISIITPVYNAEKYIARCIESVLNQELKDIEMILVDDGSSDKTGIICDHYANEDKRIKVIHKKNEGVSCARNVGLKNANGKYVLFVDADDWLEDDMCSEMYNLATINDSEVIISEYYNYYENVDKNERIILKDYPKETTFLELITEDGNGYGGFPWNKLIKRNLIDKMFNEDIHYYENLLFFLENFNEKTKYSVLHKPLYHYCINDTSAVHSKKFNVKRITSLRALSLAINLVPEKYVDEHKVVFITNYYICWYGLKKEKLELSDLSKYEKECRIYFNDVIRSKKNMY